MLDNNSGTADALDIAANVQQMEVSLALANHKPLYTGVSAEYCKVCDADIPEARRIALPGVNLCVGCAEVKERKSGR